MRRPKVWISLLILLVLGLHALPVLSYQGVGQTRWPFLAWAMYAKSFPPGPVQTSKRGVVGITLSGREEQVTPELVGLSKPTFRNLYMNALYQGDSTVGEELIQRLNRRRQDPFVQIRTDGERYLLTETGVITEKFPAITYQAASHGTQER